MAMTAAKLGDTLDVSAYNNAAVTKYELVLLTDADHLLHDAKRDLESALQLDPDHGRALCNLGLVYWRCGEQRTALATFDRAIAAANDNPHSFNNRGRLLLEMNGDHQRSLLDFHRAVCLDPRYETARRNRNEALAHLGEPLPLGEVPEPSCQIHVHPRAPAS